MADSMQDEPIQEPLQEVGVTVADTTSSSAVAKANELGAYRSLRSDVWRQFRRHKGAMAGVIVLSFIVFSCLFVPIVWPHDPIAPDTVNANLKSNWTYWFGTDNLGRDVVARTLVGGRVSLAVGFAAMFFSIFLGTFIGILAGFFRRLDGPLMRLTDLFLSLPLLPVLLLVIVLFRDRLKDALGPSLGIFILVVAIIGLTSWMQTARIVRGEVLSIKEQEFILAAHSVGTKQRRIITKHILPNVLSPVIVAASLGVAVAILTESALSFLGLGFPADFPTWGRLLFDSKDSASVNVMRIIGPALFLSLTVMSVNFIGDGLRDALDPKTRSQG